MPRYKNKKRKHSSIPKRKRFKRKSRLLSAKSWIPKYTGKNIVKGYAKRFGVDLLCSIIELKMLGIKIDNAYEQKIRQLIENKKIQKQKKRERLAQHQNNYYELYPDSDDRFYFIAGYTPNGVPYGVTWEEIGEKPPWINEDNIDFNENI